MSINRKHLSTAISHALRHDPAAYGLELDAEGWARLDDLLAGLRRKWPNLTLEMIQEVVNAASDKPRFAIMDGKIRALHGHSMPQRIPQQPAVPPETLYHGTSRESLPLILKEGLRPMSRQYVHFSVDEDMARHVGERKGEDVVILRIEAGRAHRDGVVFYRSNEAVWLADVVPPAYISHDDPA